MGAVLLAACPAPSADSTSKSGGADSLTLMVVSADSQSSTLTVKGSSLPAADKDGTQTIKVTPGDALVGYTGHQVQGELSKSEGQWRLENIWPADPDLVKATAEATGQLHRDLVDLGRNAYRDVGDTLPPFALYNQNGQIVRPSNLRGQWLVINFIFTRCANPTMCPANTTRMVQLQKEVKRANLPNITFVTISFDSAHDTPGVLRQYANDYGMELANFQLLTGPADEMKETLQQFGILIKNENGTLVHSMATFIVSPEGRITYRKPGELWTVKEFLDRLTPAAPAEKS